MKKVSLYIVLYIVLVVVTGCFSETALLESSSRKRVSSSAEKKEMDEILLKLENDILELIEKNENLKRANKELIQKVYTYEEATSNNLSEKKTYFMGESYKEFLGWVKVSEEVAIYKEAIEESEVVRTVNDEVVWVYDSFLDNKNVTWLLVRVENEGLTLGYIKVGDYLKRVSYSLESDSSEP